ncbi:MAG: Wzz/FepE/Etk N-terminal domain-containing protein [Lagierella massiliensis]|nr:Wzz/FepE/Etk N-terminal domain-containing protein [Lagierella massiliensis]
MEEISLLELLNGIKKRFIWIVLAAVLGGGIAFVANEFLIQPQYEASTTLIIGKPADYDEKNQGLEYNQILVNQKLVSTYSEIIKSRAVADEVIDNLQLNFSLERFKEEVEVITVKDTELISVVVKDSIPERAMDIANETAEIFQDKIQTVMKVDNIRILDEAILPEKPVAPRKAVNLIVGILSGVFLAIFIAITLEILDTRIKTVEELQEKFGLPVLGVIPEIKEK